MNDYTLRMIAERRVRPGDDLLSALIAAEESGDRLSPDELVAMVVQLLYAGHETTRNLIGNGLFCLLEHPAELARLRAEPALAASAVEEMLRYEPPIIFLSRIALAGRRGRRRRVREGRAAAPLARVGQPRRRALRAIPSASTSGAPTTAT